MSPDPNPADAETPTHPDTSYVNAMSHFYRGELGRMMVWRQRLDATTTWAVTSTTTIIGVAFSLRDVPHVIFFFNWILLGILLWVEARRYRFYDAIRARVRMLEAHFIVPMLTATPNAGDHRWSNWLRGDLLAPAFKMGRTEAITRRLRRTYGFIFLVVWVSWTLKILLRAEDAVGSLSEFWKAVHITGLPANFMLLVYGLATLSLISMLILITLGRHHDHDEFQGRTDPRLIE